MIPFSLQNGKRVACFPFVHLFPSCPFNIYKNIFRFIPAICKDCTVSRIPPGFLPTYEPWLIPPRIPKGFADSEQSLRLSGPPFLSRKEQFGMLAQTYFLFLHHTLRTGKFIPQDKILYEAPFWRERGPASFLLAGDS